MADFTTSTGELARAGLAHLVLALVAGVSLRSASALMPSGDDEAGPFIGI